MLPLYAHFLAPTRRPVPRLTGIPLTEVGKGEALALVPQYADVHERPLLDQVSYISMPLHTPYLHLFASKEEMLGLTSWMRHAVLSWRGALPTERHAGPIQARLPHGDRQQNCTMTPNSCPNNGKPDAFPVDRRSGTKMLLCHDSRRVDQAVGMLPPLNQETIHVASASQLNACESQLAHQREPPRCVCLAYHAPDVCRAAQSHHLAACSILRVLYVVVAASRLLPRFAVNAGSGMGVIQGADCNGLGIPIGTSRIVAIYEKGK
ncbi:hypothetical protein HDV63DRAFT_114463 [Trichoderma sp. SZMC 28014]